MIPAINHTDFILNLGWNARTGSCIAIYVKYIFSYNIRACQLYTPVEKADSQRTKQNVDWMVSSSLG